MTQSYTIPPDRRLIVSLFDYTEIWPAPYDFGDPYTKKTILYGEFNADLKKTPVTPEFITYTKADGSLTRFAPQFGRTGGKSEKTKAIRSATPAGFARAFFNANP